MTNGSEYVFGATTFFGDGSIMTRPLTKREYFAAMAMAGLISKYSTDGRFSGPKGVTTAATWSVEYADALIAALNEEK